MPTQEHQGRSSFWRDFIAGLAGPAYSAARPSDVEVNALTEAIIAAKTDVIARIKAAHDEMSADIADECADSTGPVIYVLLTAFNKLIPLAANASSERLREGYHSISKLAKPYAQQSPEFLELGRALGVENGVEVKP